ANHTAARTRSVSVTGACASGCDERFEARTLPFLVEPFFHAMQWHRTEKSTASAIHTSAALPRQRPHATAAPTPITSKLTNARTGEGAQCDDHSANATRSATTM